ncbi:coenzyme F420 hydrogenase subunit alpha FrhA [Chryseobacterium sp. StRB126]|uniref:hypothetical protein n=1 Tax=Chryseobacterium sp. StRB126 TaxID=878220 RepID=UPI0004E99938|nr:hypothetical protein [Chryseobacterium sp. StRB126]BAP30109.1 coenzyme F420 hydrogenase subunit alpha FrhA [Chryseobacterium sp. StRB126]
MSHQEKQRIFDEYAKSQGFKDWDDLQFQYCTLLMTDDEFNLYMFAACDLIQEEQQKRIAEKISDYVERFKNPDNHPPDLTDYCIMENIITNPENKIQ